MTEQLQRRRGNPRPGPGGLPSVFDREGGGNVTVCHGVYTEALPLNGMSIRDIRRRFGDRLGIDPDSEAVLDGHGTREDTVVEAGQLLTFMERAGEKGERSRYA